MYRSSVAPPVNISDTEEARGGHGAELGSRQRLLEVPDTHIFAAGVTVCLGLKTTPTHSLKEVA